MRLVAAQLYFPLAGKSLFSVVYPWFQQIRSPPLKWVEMKPRSPCTHSIPTKCTKFGLQPAPVWDMGPLLSGPSTGLQTETTRHMVGGWGMPGIWDRVWGNLRHFQRYFLSFGNDNHWFWSDRSAHLYLAAQQPLYISLLAWGFAPSMCSCESS